MSSYDAAVIDVRITEDPRLLTLPRSYRLLHVDAYVWCKAQRTDGVIPRHMLTRLAFDEPDRDLAATALVDAELWKETGTGWVIPDFLETQWGRKQVQRKRELARERYERWQEREGKKETRDKRVGNDTDITRPDLTRPEGEGRKEGGQPDGIAPEGEPPVADCADCGLTLNDDRGYGTPGKPACYDHRPHVPKLRKCDDCGLHYMDPPGDHQCQPAVAV